MEGQIRVMLAETDARAARNISSGLRAKGIQVLTVNDAAHAIGMARSEKPEVAIVSAKLAGGGPAVLRRLRSNVYTAHVPVIALVEEGAASRQMKIAGARECLPPPPDLDRLAAAVRRNLLEELDFTQAPAQEIAAPARMRDLKDTGLLDTPPEKSFDLLTRLATSLCNAPTALFSLVDKDRQFFKSHAGLPEPWASERQTRLSHSFCQWVVAGKESMVIGDATEHPVLKSNLAIRDLRVIAYAGILINGRRGEPIGSFCAVDSQRRQWSDEEVATLRDLARIAQAYAVLREGRSARKGTRAAGTAADPGLMAHVAGNAILGAAHVLRRHGAQLSAEDRAGLLGLIEEQADFLVRSDAGTPAP